MYHPADVFRHYPIKSRLDRALAVFTDVRAGEGVTALLMLANVFVLLVCYSVLKTVREPLILLGGGAEMRSYAAAGQALLLIAFVPFYSWFASRVGRMKLLVGVGLFFIAGLELFAAAVTARVPYIGVAFFIWVGIFNVSLIAQFWSFANDLYSKSAGARLFPLIMVGMTAGAPIGSFVAARLFRTGVGPAAILHVAALLLGASVLLYAAISRREHAAAAPPEPLAAGSGFRLVLSNPYLRLVAALIVLLNVVNTTGEYLVARLLSEQVKALAGADAAFNAQAYVGAFSGDYQFWVNITALVLQAFVASRLVQRRGLAGALLALPLIAFGGYAIIAAGAGFSLVRWIKTAENATDYSIMNTARQLLWLPTSREEKYKAKQAIDTFFVRGGDVLSAAVVYVGAQQLHLSVSEFAAVNLAFTAAWIVIALRLLGGRTPMPRLRFAPVARATAALLLLAMATPVFGQDTREEQLAAQQADKATRLREYQPDALERQLQRIEKALTGRRSLYPFVGGVFDGGGLAVGPGYRTRFRESGAVEAHAAWSVRNFKAAAGSVTLPSMVSDRLTIEGRGEWLDAPNVPFYGIGNASRREDKTMFAYRTATVGAQASLQAAGPLTVGGGIDAITTESAIASSQLATSLSPDYRRTHVFAEVDTRTSPGYTRSGGLYRVDWSDYRQSGGDTSGFRRVDAEVRQFIPLMRENWVIALRALASTTDTAPGREVPYFLMPDLGGSHTLRGYPSWRFRDGNRLLLSGEYRWTAGPFADMALFVDSGKVAPRARDLDLRDMTTTYGIGLSLHSTTSTAVRLELARTPNGNSVGVSFSPSF